MAQLLDLAPELLVNILHHLSYQDLLRSLTVCHRFFDVISKTPELDYQIHLQVAGLWDNPDCSLPIRTRLSLLQKQEEAWHFFKPLALSKMPVPDIPSGLFDLSPTTFSIGMATNEDTFETDGIEFFQLPSELEASPAKEPLSWTFVKTGMIIVEYCLSIEANDLFIAVVSTPDDDVPMTQHLSALILQYSTKAPHVLARRPILHLCTVTEEHKGMPSVGLDVSRENLAVSIVFQDPEIRIAASSLCVFNWRTGEAKADPMARQIPIFCTSLVFLTDDILINPNPFRPSIDIYHIRPSGSSSPDLRVRLIHSLYLPPLLQTTGSRVFISNISCISRPGAASTFPRFTQHDRPFAPDPVIPFVIAAHREDFTRQTFAMVAHRKSLLDLVPWHRLYSDDDPGVPFFQGLRSEIPPNLCSMQSWDSWGPPVTRWFSGRHLSTPYITCVSGSRYVQYGTHDLSQNAGGFPGAGERDTISIMDFNPAVVKIARQRKWEEKGLDYAEIKIFDGEGSDDALCPAGGVFASDVVGKLPFVQCKSLSRWDFDEVLMCQDHLLGLKNVPGTFRVGELAIMHFR